MDLDEPLNLLRSVVSPSLPPDTTNPIVSAAISPTVLKAQANPFEFIKTFTFFPPRKLNKKEVCGLFLKTNSFFFVQDWKTLRKITAKQASLKEQTK